MVNLLQSVTAFGASTSLQEHAALHRVKRDLVTDNGEELEEKHVQRIHEDDVAASFSDQRYFVSRSRIVQRRPQQPQGDEEREAMRAAGAGRISRYA
jgi:hypothetical protein